LKGLVFHNGVKPHREGWRNLLQKGGIYNAKRNLEVGPGETNLCPISEGGGEQPKSAGDLVFEGDRRWDRIRGKRTAALRGGRKKRGKKNQFINPQVGRKGFKRRPRKRNVPSGRKNGETILKVSVGVLFYTRSGKNSAHVPI